MCFPIYNLCVYDFLRMWTFRGLRRMWVFRPTVVHYWRTSVVGRFHNNGGSRSIGCCISSFQPTEKKQTKFKPFSTDCVWTHTIKDHLRYSFKINGSWVLCVSLSSYLLHPGFFSTFSTRQNPFGQ
jgi:hypothetical protein